MLGSIDMERIKNKCEELEKNYQKYLSDIDFISNKLDNYISYNIELLDSIINALLYELTFNTINFKIKYNPGLSIVRARKIDLIKDVYTPYNYLKCLSYIQDDLLHLVNVGRVNKKGISTFYGCICEDDNDDGMLVALNETNIKHNEHVNILYAKTHAEISLYPLGLCKYISSKKSFPFTVPDYAVNTYKFIEDNYPNAFKVICKCDQYIGDLLSRGESKEDNNKEKRLYKITSELTSEFYNNPQIDGIIYPSVQLGNHPNVVIKPNIVRNKMNYIEVVYLQTRKKLENGYEINKIKNSYVKELGYNDNIEWKNMK